MQPRQLRFRQKHKIKVQRVREYLVGVTILHKIFISHATLPPPGHPLLPLAYVGGAELEVLTRHSIMLFRRAFSLLAGRAYNSLIHLRQATLRRCFIYCPGIFLLV